MPIHLSLNHPLINLACLSRRRVAKNAAAQNIRVASLSLGGSGSVTGTCGATSDTLQQAICAVQARNVSVVVAAGELPLPSPPLRFRPSRAHTAHVYDICV